MGRRDAAGRLRNEGESSERSRCPSSNVSCERGRLRLEEKEDGNDDGSNGWLEMDFEAGNLTRPLEQTRLFVDWLAGWLAKWGQH